jgi:hypothetical protein
MYGEANWAAWPKMLASALPWPRSLVGITSKIIWKPVFIAYVMKNRPHIDITITAIG